MFGSGSMEVLDAENPAVLAYLRRLGDEILLCVNNLSKVAQPAALPLQRFAGWTPVDCFGGTPFPPIGAQAYVVTLPSHTFFWFKLESTDSGLVGDSGGGY